MALVTVEGVVSRLHGSGGGFGVKESWEVQGKDRSRYWAVFPKLQVRVQVGDRVKVFGGLQTAVTDPKPSAGGPDRVFVDHVVGSATVEVVSAAVGDAQNGGFGGRSGGGTGLGSPGPGFGAQGVEQVNGFSAPPAWDTTPAGEQPF